MKMSDMARFVQRLLIPAAAALGIAGGASAATLGDVTISGTPFYSSPFGLFVTAGDDGSGNATFEAFDDVSLEMFAFFDYDETDETMLAGASPSDLDIFDGFDSAVGSVKDFEFDALADTLSILYGLSTNSFTTDDFAVVVLIFDSGVIGAATSISDLDGEIVDADVFGAIGPAVIPLPASLPLVLAGLGGLALVGRRKRA